MTEKKLKSTKVIGYWLSEKKSQKLNWTEFGSVCGKYGYDLVKLDLSQSLEDQGPFTVILHKLTDIIALAAQGNPKAHAMTSQIDLYIKNHPEIAVIDPLDNVRKLLDRYRSYSIIHNSDLEEIDVFTPSFAELTSNDFEENLKALRLAGVDFPFVCKPSVAHGSSSAHKMAIVFNENGVKDCQPPCVAQSFITHNAILYKLFVVGNEFSLVERPSLKNFYASDHETIFFDSQDVSKADSTSSLSILDPSDQDIIITRPDSEKLHQIVCSVRKKFGMSLMGIDVIIENESGRYGIIDINAYPSYIGFPNFFDNLMNCILDIVKNHNNNKTESFEFNLPLSKPSSLSKSIDLMSPGSGDQDDSGFDTGDSSDEKKKRDLSIGSMTTSRRSSTECHSLTEAPEIC